MSGRERICIVNDKMLKLLENGDLSQATLIRYQEPEIKHKFIIDDLESDEFILKNEAVIAKSAIAIYRPRQKRLQFFRRPLELFEKLLARGICYQCS